MKPHTIMTFMVVVHTLAFGAGQAGFIDNQENSNQHKKFVDDFTKEADSKIESSDSKTSSGIVDQFSIVLKSIPVISFLVEFLGAPYSILIGSNLPLILKMLVGSIMSVGSVTATVSLWRGGIY